MRAVILCLGLGSVCCLGDTVEKEAAPATTSRKIAGYSPPRLPSKVSSPSLEAEQAVTFAKTDPVRGLFWLEENCEYNGSLVATFVTELVKTDPQKAIELYDQFDPGENRSRYTDEVAKAVSAKDLTTAWESYAAKRKDTAIRPTAGRIIAIHCGKGVEKAWNAYRSHEPEPDKKLFLSSICIAKGERSTADTIFTLNMMRTVQNCTKCEAAFENFVCNEDSKDMHLLADYLTAHPEVEKFNHAYASLAQAHLTKKEPLPAAKWMKRMTQCDDALVSQLRTHIKTASPKTQDLVAKLVPEVSQPEKPPFIKGGTD